MEVIIYPSLIPVSKRVSGSFVDRNPNLSYLVYSGDNHSVLIDACSDVAAVLRDVKERGIHLDSILLTHYHRDHTFALADWLKVFPGLPIGIHRSSISALEADGVKQLLPLADGMVIKLGTENLKVMETPGHTGDSLCFWDEAGKNLFTGDVIFGGGIGCSDYGRGGNRNIFYRTIGKLLKMLPPSTLLYPGHFSEHYRKLPPYELAGEKTNNPYLANLLEGKRGNFNRALKIFSQEFETAEVVMIAEPAIAAICEMEREIWIPELQASRETILARLRHGHRLLAVKEDEGFAGMLGWCYSPFSIEDKVADFPGSFQEFSNCRSCDTQKAHSAFIYNLGVRPGDRRKGTGSLLLQEAFEKIRKDGISEVFIDSRLPSYNGSGQHTQENIPRNEEFRTAVDRYFSRGVFPEEETFLADPAVGFYMKNGISPWLILPDFIQDQPSGNMRVICYINIDQDWSVKI